MPESRQNEKGSGHDAREPLKQKGIRTRCQRASEMIGDPGAMLESRQTIGDPGTMPESHRNDKGYGHDAGEPSK